MLHTLCLNVSITSLLARGPVPFLQQDIVTAHTANIVFDDAVRCRGLQPPNSRDLNWCDFNLCSMFRNEVCGNSHHTEML